MSINVQEEHMFNNLLARIHHDGGQYTSSVGLTKSIEDAEIIVAHNNLEIEKRDKQLQHQKVIIDRLTFIAVQTNDSTKNRLYKVNEILEDYYAY